MDAIVLAGGYATRMWPITRNRPKMFLPVGEQTVIDRMFDQLEADDRIERVFVSTNREFADAFRHYLEAVPFEKPRLSVEESRFEGEKLGVVGALGQLIDREEVSDDLLIVAGDNYISFDLSTFIDEFESYDAPTIAAYDVGSLERASSYGIVTLDGARVVDFQEKPEEPESTLVSIACYAFPADALKLFEEYLSGANNPDEPGWFVQWLQEYIPTYAVPFDDAWFDIGTPDSYLDTVAYALDGGTLIDDEATVSNSELGENVHVMAGAEVRDSQLERTVVFENATISETALESTVVDEMATVDGADLADSLIGPYTTVLENE